MAQPELRRLASLQVGRPRSLNYEGQAWKTAIYKAPVAERIPVGVTNLEGDQQANLRVHGGPDKAICCYCAEHYPYWREFLGAGDAFPHGAFGENFTLEGMQEEQVCIGDVYAVGTARVQVTQPRQPCINLVRKWDSETLPAQMIAQGHTGYYFRVLETGEAGAGDMLTLLDRPNPSVTVSLANAAMYQRAGGAALAEQFISLPEMSNEWRRVFQRRLPERV